MLADEIKKAREERAALVVHARGGCNFCGQMADVNILKGWTEEQANEVATELCECGEAKAYTRQKGQKERGHKQVEKLFGDGNKQVAVKVGAIKLLHEAVDNVVSCNTGKVTVELGAGAKATINLTGKGVLKVKRTITKNSELEA